MPDIPVPWGKDTLTLSLPQHWTVQQVAKPNLRPAPKDWRDRFARALSTSQNGHSLPKLLAARRNGRIVLVIEDLTRE